MNISSVLDLSLLATTFMTLFVIMDPPGIIPVFLALTSRYSEASQRKAALQATLTSLCVILVFAVLGQYILRFLNISSEALQMSGGILLFLIAMELLTGNDESTEVDEKNDQRTNVALVPLGTPLLAGPGAIVAVMNGVNEGEGSLSGWVAVVLAVLLMHLVIWVTMRFSVHLSKLLGQGGILILTKISGLLLAAIATQMAMSAVFVFVKTSGILG